jgi:hypothetical protein
MSMANFGLALIEPWAEPQADAYWDHFIGAVGYEHRSKYIAERYLSNIRSGVSLAFLEQKVLNYEKNLSWFQQNDFDVRRCGEDEFAEWVAKFWQDIASREHEGISICIDISSMSRLWIALIVGSLMKSDLRVPLKVDFLYARAKFSKPPDPDGPIVFAGPVSDWYAGWTDAPETPTSLVFGLGYEKDKAVGVTEYLEPSEVWAFIPTGHEKQYQDEIKRANKTLWGQLPRDHLIEYPVFQPFQCFVSLESLVSGSLRSARPVLVPFGPKTFTLCCLLVATRHYPDVSVWRVSSGAFGSPVDRVEDGTVVGLSVTFQPDQLPLTPHERPPIPKTKSPKPGER